MIKLFYVQISSNPFKNAPTCMYIIIQIVSSATLREKFHESRLGRPTGGLKGLYSSKPNQTSNSPIRA